MQQNQQQNLPKLTRQEVSTHNTKDSAWVILGNFIYDLTKFAELHPGGKSIIYEYAGKDATQEFLQFHSQNHLRSAQKLIIGQLEEKDIIQQLKPKILQLKSENALVWGTGIPHGDPISIQGYHSPYYNKSHLEFRQKCRQFVETHIEPNIDKWDEQLKTPTEIIKILGEKGIIALSIGFPFWFDKLGSQKCLDYELEKPDTFHELIFYEEFCRPGSGGILWGLLGMPMFGLPPILKFGNKEIQDRIGLPCLKGEKIICLAITEPWAGSDVAALRTTAIRSPCGKYFIVNGMKKFITNGIFADYFTTAVNTEKGMTMLAIERKTPGVKTRKMNCTGMWSSGTSFIIFEDVKVPIENIIGKEGNGFKQTLQNFNHERFMFLCSTNQLARTCYEESIKYAHTRNAFGKKLIDQPVIRNKLAKMLAKIETTQSWVEQIAYNVDRMNQEKSIKILSGVIAMAKVQASQTLEFCASEAVQVFGGKAYARAAQAAKVERIYREVKAMAVPGGSEEILLDLGIRNASKITPTL